MQVKHSSLQHCNLQQNKASYNKTINDGFSRDQAKRHLREQNAIAISNGRNGRNSGRGCFSNGLSMLDDLGNFNCNQVPSFVRTGK